MKKSLLATAAAVALIAGPALAQKQDGPKQEGPAQRTEQPTRAPAAIQSAPAEKIAPAGKAAPDRAAESNGVKSDGRAQTTGQSAPQTTGQSAPKMDDKPKASTQAPATAPAARGAADTKTDVKASDGKTGTSAGTTAQGTAATQGGGAVALSAEQKTKIRSTVLTGNAPRVTNVNFSISVGTAVPRTVRLVAVPAPLLEVHPAWRGYMYFVHGDEIVIVEPGTLRIVAVIQV